MEPRERDLWMTYIARTIVQTDPIPFPDIRSDVEIYAEETPDETLTSSRKISPHEVKRIQTVIQQYLPCPADKRLEVINQILMLCAEDEKYPYDLVFYADQAMEQSNVSNDGRIVRTVCEQMLKVYDAMAEGQRDQLRALEAHKYNLLEPIPREVEDLRHAHSTLKKHRFSLRRALVRLCKDSCFYPSSLYTNQDIQSPIDDERVRGGNFGDIYRTTMGTRFVALKSIRPSNSYSPSGTPKDIVVEAIILSRLRHDNLLDFFGLYCLRRGSQEITCIVTPWMENGELLSWCMNASKMDHAQITRIRWIYEVACGLRYLHDECVVHGDLHGRNVFVDGNMHLRIADFGLSNIAETTPSAGVTLQANPGTSHFAAPELIEEGARAGLPSDVWAFGCMCLFIWTGEGPNDTLKGPLQLTKALMKEMHIPEHPKRRMDSFYEDRPEQHAQGVTLRAQVVIPCWSHEPEHRPTMERVEEILREHFGPLCLRAP